MEYSIDTKKKIVLKRISGKSIFINYQFVINLSSRNTTLNIKKYEVRYLRIMQRVIIDFHRSSTICIMYVLYLKKEKSGYNFKPVKENLLNLCASENISHFKRNSNCIASETNSRT